MVYSSYKHCVDNCEVDKFLSLKMSFYVDFKRQNPSANSPQMILCRLQGGAYANFYQFYKSTCSKTACKLSSLINALSTRSKMHKMKKRQR